MNSYCVHPAHSIAGHPTASVFPAACLRVTKVNRNGRGGFETHPGSRSQFLAIPVVGCGRAKTGRFQTCHYRDRA
jgi:hypothetical protein